MHHRLFLTAKESVYKALVDYHVEALGIKIGIRRIVDDPHHVWSAIHLLLDHHLTIICVYQAFVSVVKHLD